MQNRRAIVEPKKYMLQPNKVPIQNYQNIQVFHALYSLISCFEGSTTDANCFIDDGVVDAVTIEISVSRSALTTNGKYSSEGKISTVLDVGLYLKR
jgi:hypothetical protein